jgi:DNA-binding MarR family transcriptional regulator
MSTSPFKFLRFSASIRRINKRYKLNDLKEVMTLEAILGAYEENVSFSVLDVILLVDIASQATLHSVLKGLIAKKLIKSESCTLDKRRKYVTPTKLALEWLKDSTDLLCSAAKK